MAEPTTLLVASAGGHLRELVRLQARLGDLGASVWVTYDVPHARALLEGETVVGAHHPTTRNLANAARNLRLARRVLDEHAITRVVSTGAAVAVPFMVAARRRGLPCHYLESATRTEGPSLAGRMLAAVPGVRRYRQLGEWGGSRWRPGPCVFDGFAATAAAGAPVAPRRLLVSLGTHGFGFDAFVERLRGVVGDETAVTWQLGGTAAPADLDGDVRSSLSPAELEDEIRAADVVVGHAGVGLALTALALGKVPVLVPRRRSRREHADDHQVALARELDRRGLAVVAEVGELTREHLERAAGLVATWDEPPPFHLAE